MSGFKKTVLVDFDGVIHSYTSGWKGEDVVTDPPVEGAIEWLRSMCEDPEFEVCIYSSRSLSSSGRAAMREWLSSWGAPVDKIKFPSKKPAAWLTVDDRAFCFEGTFPTAEFISNFKPWNKR